eukprot:TRINITY_DN7063_c0_g1_i1.p1 TRINITY_DN7063_c0_g1~~TRINITY_DN7063_c0_g1_i1.p1  ORF type:complete len:1204 (-),score=398.76 TRINITY_DN7063_c0_g1_i1:89-3376(-)
MANLVSTLRAQKATATAPTVLAQGTMPASAVASAIVSSMLASDATATSTSVPVSTPAPTTSTAASVTPATATSAAAASVAAQSVATTTTTSSTNSSVSTATAPVVTPTPAAPLALPASVASVPSSDVTSDTDIPVIDDAVRTSVPAAASPAEEPKPVTPAMVDAQPVAIPSQQPQQMVAPALPVKPALRKPSAPTVVTSSTGRRESLSQMPPVPGSPASSHSTASSPGSGGSLKKKLTRFDLNTQEEPAAASRVPKASAALPEAVRQVQPQPIAVQQQPTQQAPVVPVFALEQLKALEQSKAAEFAAQMKSAEQPTAAAVVGRATKPATVAEVPAKPSKAPEPRRQSVTDVPAAPKQPEAVPASVEQPAQLVPQAKPAKGNKQPKPVEPKRLSTTETPDSQHQTLKHMPSEEEFAELQDAARHQLEQLANSVIQTAKIKAKGTTPVEQILDVVKQLVLKNTNKDARLTELQHELAELQHQAQQATQQLQKQQQSHQQSQQLQAKQQAKQQKQHQAGVEAEAKLKASTEQTTKLQGQLSALQAQVESLQQSLEVSNKQRLSAENVVKRQRSELMRLEKEMEHLSVKEHEAPSPMRRILAPPRSPPTTASGLEVQQMRTDLNLKDEQLQQLARALSTSTRQLDAIKERLRLQQIRNTELVSQNEELTIQHRESSKQVQDLLRSLEQYRQSHAVSRLGTRSPLRILASRSSGNSVHFPSEGDMTPILRIIDAPAAGVSPGGRSLLSSSRGASTLGSPQRPRPSSAPVLAPDHTTAGSTPRDKDDEIDQLRKELSALNHKYHSAFDQLNRLRASPGVRSASPLAGKKGVYIGDPPEASAARSANRSRGELLLMVKQLSQALADKVNECTLLQQRLDRLEGASKPIGELPEVQVVELRQRVDRLSAENASLQSMLSDASTKLSSTDTQALKAEVARVKDQMSAMSAELHDAHEQLQHMRDRWGTESAEALAIRESLAKKDLLELLQSYSKAMQDEQRKSAKQGKGRKQQDGYKFDYDQLAGLVLRTHDARVQFLRDRDLVLKRSQTDLLTSQELVVELQQRLAEQSVKFRKVIETQAAQLEKLVRRTEEHTAKVLSPSTA